MIDLTLLRQALTIAEEGSFSSAAKSLHLSQPTLTRQIRTLEASLGLRLFDRGRFGAVPTPLGQQVLARAARLVRSAEILDDEIDLLRGVEVGELKVGAGVYPACVSLGRALARLTGRRPQLHVSVRVEDWRGLPAQVLDAKLDLAIVEIGEHANHPELKVEALPEHQGVFVCRAGHPLLDHPEPGLTEVFAYPFAGTRLAPRVASVLVGHKTAGRVDEATGEYVPSIEVNTIRLMTEAARTSDAFGLVPLLTAVELCQDGRLRTLPLRPPWLKTRYGFITLKHRTLSPAAEAFMDEIRAVEAELAAEEAKALAATTPRRRGRRA